MDWSTRGFLGTIACTLLMLLAVFFLILSFKKDQRLGKGVKAAWRQKSIFQLVMVFFIAPVFAALLLIEIGYIVLFASLSFKS
jgi:hypothetical protein